jgi:hypothetical protein
VFGVVEAVGVTVVAREQADVARVAPRTRGSRLFVHDGVVERVEERRRLAAVAVERAVARPNAVEDHEEHVGRVGHRSTEHAGEI